MVDCEIQDHLHAFAEFVAPLDGDVPKQNKAAAHRSACDRARGDLPPTSVESLAILPVVGDVPAQSWENEHLGVGGAAHAHALEDGDHVVTGADHVDPRRCCSRKDRKESHRSCAHYGGFAGNRDADDPDAGSKDH